MGKDHTKVIDPTENVKALVEIHAKYDEALRVAHNELDSERTRHIAEMATLRADRADYIAELRAANQKEISTKETERIDTVQKVVQQNTDRVATTAADAIKAQALAMVELASTLAAQKSISDDAMSKRVAALEMAKSEGAGSKSGTRDVGGLIITLIGLAISVGTFLFVLIKK